VPEYCTCGAELPPDARFCHKCGKPQREEPHLVEEPAGAAPQQQLPPAPPQQLPPAPQFGPAPIGFRNPVVFRIAFFAALLSLVLNMLLFEACPVWLAAAGFFGVWLYHRRSGEFLTIRSGARMGWITGIISFVLFSLPFSIGFINVITQPDFVNKLREELSKYPFPASMQDQMLATFQTPGGVAMQVIMLLLLLFVLFTLFPLLGGMLGAKVLSKD